METKTNEHHILNMRRDWHSTRNANILRMTPELRPQMDVHKHEELHRVCPHVPLLGREALHLTLVEFETVSGDTARTIDNLLFSIENASKNKRVGEFERNLARKAIEAILMQKDFMF